MLVNGATGSWESVGEDPSVRELAERLASHAGNRSPKSFLASLKAMARDISVAGVLSVARQEFLEHDLEFSVVKNRVRAYANKNTPSWAFCTAGNTSLEISPNGYYGRCPKTGAKQIYMGDLREEGPLKALDLAGDDLSCNIRCPQLMCFTNNVIRGTDQHDFDHHVHELGLRGAYGPERLGYHSKIFIRWKVTDVCNYTCAYCTDWRTVNKRGTELTDAEMMTAAKKIVDQFSPISMRLTGGEPSSRRCYLDLMRLFHDNLDRFTDIEIRTNLSYQAKHKEVLSWDWDGKLHLHVGCHIRDKNFMPWRTVELFREAPDADYVLKFVCTPPIRHHIMFFQKYFVDNGIPPRNIRVIEEVSRKEENATELEEAPAARKTLEGKLERSAAAGAAPECAEPAHGNCAANGSGGKRFTLAELRAMTDKKPGQQADRADVPAEAEQDDPEEGACAVERADTLAA